MFINILLYPLERGHTVPDHMKQNTPVHNWSCTVHYPYIRKRTGVFEIPVQYWMGNSENISPKDFNKTRWPFSPWIFNTALKVTVRVLTKEKETNKKKKGGAPHMERRKYTCLCLYLTSYTGMQFPYVVEKFAISVHHR